MATPSRSIVTSWLKLSPLRRALHRLLDQRDVLRIGLERRRIPDLHADRLPRVVRPPHRFLAVQFDDRAVGLQQDQHFEHRLEDRAELRLALASAARSAPRPARLSSSSASLASVMSLAAPMNPASSPSALNRGDETLPQPAILAVVAAVAGLQRERLQASLPRPGSRPPAARSPRGGSPASSRRPAPPRGSARGNRHKRR